MTDPLFDEFFAVDVISISAVVETLVNNTVCT